MLKALIGVVVLTLLILVVKSILTKAYAPSKIADYQIITANTDDWKSYQKHLDVFSKTVNLRYPSSWSIVESNGSGHPNFLMLTGNQGSCVKVSISSDHNSLDEELKNAATQWSVDLPDNNIEKETTLLVNSNSAKIRAVNREGNKFMDGAINIGSDSRFSGSTVYAILSSCGRQEERIFNSVLESIIYK